MAWGCFEGNRRIGITPTSQDSGRSEPSNSDSGPKPFPTAFDGSVDTLFPLVYSELRRIAGSVLGAGANKNTLQPTALINEAYIKLAHLPEATRWTRPHFLAVAALAMRQILANRARDRSRLKRGGNAERLTLHEDALAAELADDDVVALDEALKKLAEMDARKARVVEMRFFGGMSVEDIGAALDIGTATVKRDWAMARAWLVRELGRGDGNDTRAVEETR
jgi:RNA polymerase sigma factor (TIGR02999 family)